MVQPARHHRLLDLADGRFVARPAQRDEREARFF
jgi:hypothetical protein